jgi:sugar/nucleoside kinase (ribokinase family)
MTKALTSAGVDVDHIQVLDGHTSSVVLLIEPDGERTIIGIHPDLLHQITIPAAAVAPRDIVYFAAWHDRSSKACGLDWPGPPPPYGRSHPCPWKTR